MNNKFIIGILMIASSLLAVTACAKLPSSEDSLIPTPNLTLSSSPSSTQSQAASTISPNPSPAIAGEWKLAGKVSEVGISAGTTGQINGKDYLFLGTGSNGPPPEAAIRVLDLGDPASPVEVGKLETDGKTMLSIMSLELSGTVLYATTLNYLWIIDVSNPASPKEISRFPTQWSTGTAISGEYAYIMDYQKISVAGIADPAHPQGIGNFALSPLAMKISGSSLLAVTRDGLHILDISDPSSLKEIGSFANPSGPAPEDWSTLPMEQMNLFLDIQIAGKYAYIASGISGLRVLDISNPAAPVEVAQFKTQGVASRLLASGNYTYLIDWRKPLTPNNPLPVLFINISDPGNPREMAAVDLPPYFNFHFTGFNNYLYYYGNDPSLKIVKGLDQSIEDDPLMRDAAILAQATGMTVDEAYLRLKLQEPAGELGAQLADREAATFAGLWIENTPEYRIVAAFTHDGEKTIKPYLSPELAGYIEVRTAKLSLVDLQNLQSTTMSGFRSLGIQFDSGIDIKKNRVYFNIQDRAKFEQALQSSKTSLPDNVDINFVNTLASPV